MELKTSNEVVCVAHLVAKDGQREALFNILKTLIQPSKNEPGCVSYQLHCGLENPNQFTFIDRFKDQAAFDEHCNASYVQEAFDELIPPLVESMDITTHQEIYFNE